MIVEGGIATERGDNRRAGLDVKARDQAQKPVNALSDDDVLRLYTMLAGQRRAQVGALRVAILPDVMRGAPDGLDHAGRGAKAVLIGTEPGAKWAPRGALLRFRPHEGHGGREGLCKWGKRWASCHGPCLVCAFSD